MHGSGVEIRRYRSGDASATLAVFIVAVTVTAASDYSPEQIAAWARPERRNPADWDRAMSGRNSYVALVDGEIAGFSDVNADGYIDMMFVAPRYTRHGVARTLLETLEATARESGAQRLSANVSITARPFFEHQGFVAVAKQHPIITGVRMINFHMTKPLEPSGRRLRGPMR